MDQNDPFDLSDVLMEISIIKRELGFSGWSDLNRYADNWVHPSQLDNDGLDLLLERLIIHWADSHQFAQLALDLFMQQYEKRKSKAP